MKFESTTSNTPEVGERVHGIEGFEGGIGIITAINGQDVIIQAELPYGNGHYRVITGDISQLTARRSKQQPEAEALETAKLIRLIPNAENLGDLASDMERLDALGVTLVDGYWSYEPAIIAKNIRAIQADPSKLTLMPEIYGLRATVSRLLEESGSEFLSNDEILPSSEILDGDINVIADVHGNFDIFVSNLQSLGVVDANLDWRAGASTLNLLGDLIADRGAGDIEILELVHKLSTQAEAAGGTVNVLMGNHDDFAVAYLTGRSPAGSGDIEGYFANGQARGIGVFLEKFLGVKGIENFRELPPELQNGRELLGAMRNSNEGRAMLETICKMDVVNLNGTTLFTHTDLTSEMAQLLIKHDPDTLNNIFKTGLRAQLLGEGKEPAGFREIVDAFLATENREYCTAAEADQLVAKYDISRAIHGHTDRSAQVTTRGKLELCSLDISAGKKGHYMNRRSCARVRDNQVSWKMFGDREKAEADNDSLLAT